LSAIDLPPLLVEVFEDLLANDAPLGFDLSENSGCSATSANFGTAASSDSGGRARLRSP